MAVGTQPSQVFALVVAAVTVDVVHLERERAAVPFWSNPTHETEIVLWFRSAEPFADRSIVSRCPDSEDRFIRGWTTASGNHVAQVHVLGSSEACNCLSRHIHATRCFRQTPRVRYHGPHAVRQKPHFSRDRLAHSSAEGAALRAMVFRATTATCCHLATLAATHLMTEVLVGAPVPHVSRHSFFGMGASETSNEPMLNRKADPRLPM